MTAMSFYWRNDTPTFCHLTEFLPEIVRPLPCSSYITVCLFFREVMSFIAPLDKCHASVFNALIFSVNVLLCKSVRNYIAFV